MGKPVERRFNELESVMNLAHMEQVDHLKSNFAIGHGHANALVAHFRKSKGL